MVSDGYDRNNSNSGVTFMMGLLTGAVIGAGVGLLFTTKAGEDLRNQLADQASKVADQASQGVKKATATAGEWADRGREVYGRAKDAAVKGADEAQAYVRDNSNAAATAIHETSNTAANAVEAAGRRI